MATLDRNLRRDLENAVKKARRVAEAGARQAIEQLAVGHHEPWSTLTLEQRKIRNRLRAHGRQLGDKLDERKGTQTIERLTGECAYEHWHRLLFARFLAENELLVEAESGMALSLDECRELAREQGKDWLVLASDFAQRMLPQIFRAGDPVLEIALPPETRQELELVVESQPQSVFLADDSLGWCYQFWQADKKNEANAAGNKIGAEELPAVTQLFTEDYMVDVLLDNTLGAWHAGKVLAANAELAKKAHGEDELRDAVSLPGCRWKYLRFIKDQSDKWTPAAGTYERWPRLTREITCLDPCMGSGHFVIAMFQRLVALRIADEKLNQEAAVTAVIRDNLFGLELDPRCTQISAFNLALAAWRRVGYCPLPTMNLACSGLAPNTRESAWLAVAGTNQKLQRGMEKLYRLFQRAAVLGSLINPRLSEEDLFVAAFHELQPVLEKALAREAADENVHEMAVTARGIAKAAEILAGRFTLVATNVPYLGFQKQHEILADYCERVHPEGKADLSSCFIERCLEFSAVGGTSALVTPQNWLFLARYRKLRKTLLGRDLWSLAHRLGPGAFETISGEVVKASLVVLSRVTPSSQSTFCALDVSGENDPRGKANALCLNPVAMLHQKESLDSPDSTVSLDKRSELELLAKYADSYTGAHTLDIQRFRLFFWELGRLGQDWRLHASTPSGPASFSGMEYVSFTREAGKPFAELASRMKDEGFLGGWLSGNKVWGKRGIACSWMGKLPVSLYTGSVFDNSVAVILPKNLDLLPAIWSFCSSAQYAAEVRKINQKMQVASATLVKVPFDLAHWQRVAAEKYPRGLPSPFSSDPTQWVFNGHPADSDLPLQVAVSRLLDYRWPRLTGSGVSDCPALAADGLEALADADGIVCIPAVKSEATAVERLRQLLAMVYPSDWNASKLDKLIRETDLPANQLDDWLIDGFFTQHCGSFHHRPFIWHIWDGLKTGFNVLVNYHKLSARNGEGRRTLERLIYTYLGDWIDRQRADQKAGVEGADGRVAAAEHLRQELEKILEGEPPYDIFVRWKPLHEQPIGWAPDPDDGVRVNIRPFMAAKPLNARGKNACILRVAPKINWDKDRGKEPAREKSDFPWFWGWDGSAQDFMGGKDFDGNRWNDLHYTRASKLAARERVKVSKS